MVLSSMTKRFLELAVFMSQCIELSSSMTFDYYFNKIVVPPSGNSLVMDLGG